MARRIIQSLEEARQITNRTVSEGSNQDSHNVEGALKSNHVQLSNLEKELKELKESLLTMRARAVEDFCSSEGPLLRISDSFVTGFYKYKELALQRPEELEELEAPSEIGVTPQLETKIAEKRSDAFAITDEKSDAFTEPIAHTVIYVSLYRYQEGMSTARAASMGRERENFFRFLNQRDSKIMRH
ncbi:hypothetical protein LguiA_030245 [Lonicera macranthoides]